MKYNSYRELLEAYKTGELSRDHILYVDNDETFVMGKNGKCIFRGDGYGDIDTLLELLGFPYEWV